MVSNHLRELKQILTPPTRLQFVAINVYLAIPKFTPQTPATAVKKSQMIKHPSFFSAGSQGLASTTPCTPGYFAGKLQPTEDILSDRKATVFSRWELPVAGRFPRD